MIISIYLYILTLQVNMIKFFTWKRLLLTLFLWLCVNSIFFNIVGSCISAQLFFNAFYLRIFVQATEAWTIQASIAQRSLVWYFLVIGLLLQTSKLSAFFLKQKSDIHVHFIFYILLIISIIICFYVDYQSLFAPVRCKIIEF